ncbi:sugar ABC transporter substrate-binding protein [Anaerolineales bacterium HSG6]|nr:sugar ABC transporter substrate-binding protein [Anaerolineales bacterium HSG6]MDM8531610.1 sugar ABC transporter substrate-binding protein [Anaerolineales bacterium HSG25]
MRKFLTIFFVVSLLMTLAACGGDEAAPASDGGKDTAAEAPAEEKALAVGIVLPTKDEPRWVQDEARFKDALAKAGYGVEILFSQGDSAKEKSNVEDLITKGVKVLIITPQDGAAAAASANAAKEAGIDVISYDRLIQGTDAVDYYVTFDSLAVGAQQAQYLVDNTSGTGHPLYLYAGAASDNNAFIFFQGAWEVLQPKIADGTFVIKNSDEAVALQDKAELNREELANIIGQITTNWDFNTAKNLAEANLTVAQAEDKGEVFILAPNDGTARAIADVYAADTDVTTYHVTGQDAEKASLQYIIDGKQSMTVFKDVRTLVDDAINAAVALLEGKTPTAKGTYNNGSADIPAIQSSVVTIKQANVKALINDYYADSIDEFDFSTLGEGVSASEVGGKVGIVLPTKDEPRWVQDEARFKEQLEAAGYEVEILFSQGDSAKEKSNVEDLITKGVQVLIITPQDGAAAAASANAAREAGIQVISYDRLIRGTDAVDYYVTFDSVAVGAQQAQYLIDNAEGSGNPLYLYAGAASDNNAFIFFQGAWEVLQPKIADGTFVIKNSDQAIGLQDKADLNREEQANIIGQITTNWDFNTAKNLAEANLTVAQAEDKGEVFILAPNDGTARAIADVFAADTDVSVYHVTGQDAEKASLQYIIDGKQSMTVFKDVRTLVGDAISAAIAILEGGEPIASGSYDNGAAEIPAIQSPVVTIKQANVKALIEDYYADSVGEFDFATLGDGVSASEVGGKVGIVLPTKDEPRWVQDEVRFKETLEAAGYEVEILFSQGDSAKERSNVEDLITKGVQVLIVTPQDGAAAAASANAAKEAGIQVISYDRLILGTDTVDYYVTFDSKAVGAQQAQYLINNAEGSGNPLYLYAGAASDNNAFIFFQGAWEVLQPKIADGTFVIKNSDQAIALQNKADLSREEQANIIGQVTTNWDFNTAKNLAEANLTVAQAEDKGEVFILAPNDGTARAIADVFATDTDVSAYHVTGQDAEKASLQYIIDGKQSMTVFKDVRTLVGDAINAAVSLLEGGEPIATGSYDNGAADIPAIQSEVVTIKQDNVKGLIEDYYADSIGDFDFSGLE